MRAKLSRWWRKYRRDKTRRSTEGITALLWVASEQSKAIKANTTAAMNPDLEWQHLSAIAWDDYRNACIRANKLGYDFDLHV